jgi:hypothetical protein
MTRSKTKKPRKQKPKTMKHVPDQLPKPEIKVSEAILKLSEPLRNQIRDSHRTRVIISMTVIAWNISLLPEEKQANAQESLIDALPENISAEELSIFMEYIDIMIKQKKEDYPYTNEYIQKYRLSYTGDTIALTVNTTSVT